MKRYFWTTAELETLRREYSAGGLNAAESALPNRSRSSIYNKAGQLRLRSPRQTTAVRQSWPHDEHIDQQIRFAHQQQPKKGDVQRLAKRLGRPQWWVSKRARDLGLMTPRFKEPAWQPEELAIVESTREQSPAVTQRHLRRAGFVRSLTACIVKRKRLGITVPERVGVYLTGELAELLGYERCSITRWVRMGLLKASGAEEQARITDAQVREFICRHPLQLDLRKLPLGSRPWLIELLSGRGADVGAKVA